MAGDWIKIEHATLDKPEVLAMADALETTSDDVLGKLIRVWCWFDKQSEDGNAGSVTGVTLMKFIDRLVSSQGFAACMKKVGWLTDRGMPNFELHNGESAKKRGLTHKRQKRFRNAQSDDSVTLSALPEKRREESKPIRAVPSRQVESAAFTRFWQAYPRKKSKGDAEKAWTKINPDEQLQDRIIDAIERAKTSADWRKDGGQFIPHPATWLNRRGWEDEPTLLPEAPRRLAI